MHVFILILSIMGQPERVAAICETYKQCSDAGAAASVIYQAEFNRPPSAFSYRVVTGVILETPKRPTA